MSVKYGDGGRWACGPKIGYSMQSLFINSSNLNISVYIFMLYANLRVGVKNQPDWKTNG